MGIDAPEDSYLQKLGLVVFLVAELENFLMLDLVRLDSVLPRSCLRA